MFLLHKIQEAIAQEDVNLGPVLLKLHILASRLGDGILEKWVSYESEGYPDDVTVPSYRIVGITHEGTFSDPYGNMIKNHIIPPYFIEELAGEKWLNHQMRDSIVEIDYLLKNHDGRGNIATTASANMALLLGEKIFKGYSCISVTGIISPNSLVKIRHIVLHRILQLISELEKSVPAASTVTFGSFVEKKENSENTQQISQQISQQIINHGPNFTTIASGKANTVNINTIGKQDTKSLIEYLVSLGIPESGADDFAKIVQAEKPISQDEPFGRDAKKWITENLKKLTTHASGISMDVMKKAITEAVLKFWGLS